MLSSREPLTISMMTVMERLETLKKEERET
jgi:hypothetical protein